MKISQELYSLRSTQSEATLQKIEALCPVPFGTDELFEKSYQKFEALTGAVPHRPRARYYQVIGLAACLLLTVGMGVGVWGRQQPIEPAPQQQGSAAASTTAVTETTEVSSETKASAQVTTAVSTAAQTSQSEQTHVTEPTKAATHAPQQTQAPSVTPVQTEVTAPAAEPVDVTEAPAISPTEVTAAPSEMPAGTTAVPPTEMPVEAEPVPAAEQIQGFRVMQYAGFRQVTCMDAFPEPDGELNACTFEDDAVTLLDVTDAASDMPVRSYEIGQGGKTFTVTQQEYAAFVMDVEEGDLIDIGVSRVHGFFLLKDEQCTLYWFCEGEGFCVHGDAADLGSLLAIVRSFTPAA